MQTCSSGEPPERAHRESESRSRERKTAAPLVHDDREASAHSAKWPHFTPELHTHLLYTNACCSLGWIPPALRVSGGKTALDLLDLLDLLALLVPAFTLCPPALSTNASRAPIAALLWRLSLLVLSSWSMQNFLSCLVSQNFCVTGQKCV